jgi:hypothetical protein
MHCLSKTRKNQSVPTRGISSPLTMVIHDRQERNDKETTESSVSDEDERKKNPSSSVTPPNDQFNLPTAHRVSVMNDDKTTLTSPGIRKELGKLTGISLTAIRASVRATTGFSLTALRTTLRTLTGVSITRVVKTLVGLLPPWFRYFLQPFLILYYVPILVLREMIGSTSTSKKEAYEEHDKLVNYWKEAIQLAENRCESWPLHVKTDGTLQYDLDDDRMNDVIVDAIEMKHVDENHSC